MAEYIPPLSELVSWLYVMHTAGASMYEAVSSYTHSQTGFYADELIRIVRLVDMAGCDPYTAVELTVEKTNNKEFGDFLSEYSAAVKTSGSPVSYLKSRLESLRAEEKATEEKRFASLSVFAEIFISVFVAGILFAVIVFLMLGIMNNSSPLPLSSVVYGILPLGTLGFLLSLDLLYPSPPKEKTKRTAVKHSITPLNKTEKQILHRFSGYERRRGFHCFLRNPADTVISYPILTFIITIPAGAAVSTGLLLKHLLPAGTAAAIGLILGFFPYAVFSFCKNSRISAAESGFPSVCRILSSAASRGLTLSKGLSEAALNTHGMLGKELSAAVRDIRLCGGVYDSLGRLRDRLQIPSVDRLTPLIQEASKHSADMSYPFSLCADEAAFSVERAVQRKSSMQLYVLIMYISYGVFIFVQFMLTGVFMDSFVTSGNGVNIAVFSGILSDAVLIHGVCCGLAAGKLSGSGLSGGILHACILLSVGTAASVVMMIL